MDEVRNQLKSQNFATVSPTAFGEVGGRVFPDNPSIADVNDLIEIVKGWRAVHLPSLGSPIGRSSTLTSQNGDGTILSPSNAQVFNVKMLAFENGDVQPTTFVCQIVNPGTGQSIPVLLNPDPSAPANSLIVPAGETLTVNVDLILDSNVALFVAITNGDPASNNIVSYHYLTSQ